MRLMRSKSAHLVAAARGEILSRFVARLNASAHRAVHRCVILARHKLVPVAVNCAAVVARAVSVVVADAAAYDRATISRAVIGIRIAVVAVSGRIICGWIIITAIIRCYIRPLRAST